jgi:hypothetical protein
MSTQTFDDIVKIQRQEKEQIEETLTVTLPELRTGDLNIPLETIQLRVYRRLPSKPDEERTHEASPASRWKEVG